MEILDILKVSSKSSPKSVAGAITAITREKRPVELQAVGAGAVNQAAKAIAIARSNLALFGIDLVCIPAFDNVMIDDEQRTAIKFICDRR